MPGTSDYLATRVLNFRTGQAAMPALGTRFLALFTAAPTSNSGTGGTECSGNGYARAQYAGSVTTNNTTASGNATLHFSSLPTWITALGPTGVAAGVGMTVTDTTTSGVIATGTSIIAVGTTTLTMSTNATGGGVGSGDTLVFCAFPAASASSGTEPAVAPGNVANGAAISYPQATGSGFGTVVAFGEFDASSGGNCLGFDFLGAYNWLPFSCTSASPGVLTVPGHGFSNGNSVVVTAKFGGTLPTTGGSWSGVLTVANVTTNTFTAGVNTTGVGDGMVRKVAPQTVPNGVVFSFAASTLTLNLA